MNTVYAFRPNPVRFSAARTINKDFGIANSKDINTLGLQKLNREIFNKENDFAWLPVARAKQKIDDAFTSGTINKKNKSGNTLVHNLFDVNKYKIDYDSSNTSRESKYKELVNYVLEKNPDINIKGNGGESPLRIAIDFADAAANGNPAYPDLYQVIQEAVVSLLKKGAFVKKADLKALPKNEEGTKDLRKQVKSYYEAQRSSIFARMLAWFK